MIDLTSRKSAFESSHPAPAKFLVLFRSRTTALAGTPCRRNSRAAVPPTFPFAPKSDHLFFLPSRAPLDLLASMRLTPEVAGSPQRLPATIQRYHLEASHFRSGIQRARKLC